MSHDAKPEWGHYPADTGCALAPRCLECPLAQCQYDLPPRERRLNGYELRAQRARDRLILRLYNGGTTVSELSRQFGMTRATIYSRLYEQSSGLVGVAVVAI